MLPVRPTSPCHAVQRRRFLAGGLGVAGGLLAGGLLPGPGHAATAPRHLVLLRPDADDRIEVQYWDGVAYDLTGLGQLDWFMRDRREQASRVIDTQLYELLLRIQRLVGGRPLHLTSGFRTRKTNEMLRRRSQDVARRSYHIRGMAADLQIPGYSPRRLVEVAQAAESGGIGRYDSFIHCDCGPQRFWTGS